jgi:hypothetical protein
MTYNRTRKILFILWSDFQEIGKFVKCQRALRELEEEAGGPGLLRGVKKVTGDDIM